MITDKYDLDNIKKAFHNSSNYYNNSVKTLIQLY